jgi:hypothetical protein
MMYRVVLSLTVVMGWTFFAGCGGEDVGVTDGDALPVRTAQDVEDGYRMILRGIVTDTLTGRAQFGHVLEPRSGATNWIIEFVSAEDFAGGVFIAAPTEALPEARRYSITADALADPSPDAFAVFYRHGLYRVFRGRSGSITFSHVSDSLVSGSFDAVLVGEVSDRGREAIRGDTEVSATFSARRGQPGYVIGM